METSERGFTAGDMNQDGYPDVALETTVHVLVNLGERRRCVSGVGCGAAAGQCTGSDGANFRLVEDCYGVDITAIETFCWGDADGDDDLDLFMPSEGNTYFLLNRGPGDPECDPNDTEAPRIWWMEELDTEDIGLERSPESLPEGCQWTDIDRDGDLDLIFNHRIYQNDTAAADEPNFTVLDPNVSGFENLPGIDPENRKDEGLVAVDIDMDGDEDIVRTTQSGSGFVNANRGDGSFDAKFDTAITGGAWGAGFADLDNDGDIDLTFGGQFVRNTVVETTSLGAACLFGQCLHETGSVFEQIGASNLLPSFADVDRDGDLDCALVFMNSNPHRLLRNRFYRDDCAEADRRYVNVRPVRACDPNVAGPPGRDFTENEFGARVELVLRNNPIENITHLRRVQCTSSAGGYLNQHEYQVHIGLPSDPDPNDPNEDLRFDLYVDFPTRSNDGPWRVDWTVNAQLAGGNGLPGINLADLYVDPNDPNTFGRPVTVYRDGRVRFKGADPNFSAVDDPGAARLYTLGGPLRLPEPNVPMPDPNTGAIIAGLRFTKSSLSVDPNGVDVRVREIIVDGQLDQGTYGCDYNVAVVDVTDPNNPVTMGALKAYTFPDNNRTFILVPPDPNDPNAFVIPADPNNTRTYDVRVRVTEYRANLLSDLSALQTPLGVVVTGGLQSVTSASNDICTKKMNLTFGGSNTSPVKVRLSRKTN